MSHDAYMLPWLELEESDGNETAVSDEYVWIVFAAPRRNSERLLEIRRGSSFQDIAQKTRCHL